MTFNIKPAIAYYIYRGGFSFLFAFVTTIFSIYHIESVNLNPFQLVIIGTILELTCFVFEVPTGIIADHYSRKLSIVIGLIIMGIGLFLEGYFQVFIIIAIAQIIWGFGATFISGADIAWISDESEQKGINSILLKASQVSQLAIILGIIASIQLATYELHFPFLISGIGFIILALLIWWIMPETKFKALKKSNLKIYFSTLKRGFSQVKNNRLLIIIFSIILIGGLFNEGWDRLWTYRFIKDITLPLIHNLNPIYWFAIINIVAAVINFTVIQISKNKIEGSSLKKLFSIQLLLNFFLGSSIIFFALTENYYLALASYWAVYTSRNTALPINDIIINKNIDDSSVRATVFSLKGQMDQIGQMIGGPIIGIIALKFSVSIGLLSIGIIIIPILLLYFYLWKRDGS